MVEVGFGDLSLRAFRILMFNTAFAESFCFFGKLNLNNLRPVDSRAEDEIEPFVCNGTQSESMLLIGKFFPNPKIMNLFVSGFKLSQAQQFLLMISCLSIVSKFWRIGFG